MTQGVVVISFELSGENDSSEMARILEDVREVFADSKAFSVHGAIREKAQEVLDVFDPNRGT